MRTLDLKRIALAGLAVAILALAGCGDDESEDVATESDIEVSIPSATDASEDGEQSKAEKKGAIPPITDVPQPSEDEQQRINECIEQAQGDPNKIIDCTKIANE